MTNTHTDTLPHGSLTETLRHILPAVLLFSIVLFGLLALSWTMVLPRYTSLEVDGHTLQAAAVPMYVESLEGQIASAEARRDDLTLPLRDPLYAALRLRAHEAVSLTDLEQLLTIMLAEAEYGPNVVIGAMRLDGDEAEIEGDIRGVGPRSVTLLARFVEDLGAQSFVADLVPPAFSRDDDPVIGIRSPFLIKFRASVR